MTALPRPTLTVIAGSNGAGKSTLSATLRMPSGVPILDPDAVARTLRPDAPAQVAAQAAREVLRRQREYLADRQSFAVETTLAGTRILYRMEEARQHGFAVHLIYIGVEDVRIALDRIAMRVAQGGHAIPEGDVRRRFARSLHHLAAAIARADQVTLVDNTAEDGPRTVLAIDQGRVTMQAEEMPQWVRATLGDIAGTDGATRDDEGGRDEN